MLKKFQLKKMEVENNNRQAVVVYGDSDFAEQVYYQLESDGRYEVLAFTVDEQFLRKAAFMGLPLIPFQQLHEKYSAKEVLVFPAIGYSKLNTIRERVVLEIEQAGYRLLTYISKLAYIGANTKIGDGSFICEFVSVKPKTQIGKCVVLFPHTSIGHNVRIEDFTYLSICVAVGGNAIIQRNCFIGMHATIRNSIQIGSFNVIGTAGNVVQSTEPNGIYVGNPAKRLKEVDLNTLKF